MHETNWEGYPHLANVFVWKQADKLLKAIKQHYQQEKNKTEPTQVTRYFTPDQRCQCQKELIFNVNVLIILQGQQDYESAVQDGKNSTQDKTLEEGDTSSAVSSTAEFVNTRRGKGKRTKRKISEIAVETESDVKSPAPSPVKVAFVSIH